MYFKSTNLMGTAGSRIISVFDRPDVGTSDCRTISIFGRPDVVTYTPCHPNAL